MKRTLGLLDWERKIQREPKSTFGVFVSRPESHQPFHSTILPFLSLSCFPLLLIPPPLFYLSLLCHLWVYRPPRRDREEIYPTARGLFRPSTPPLSLSSPPALSSNGNMIGGRALSGEKIPLARRLDFFFLSYIIVSNEGSHIVSVRSAVRRK